MSLEKIKEPVPCLFYPAAKERGISIKAVLGDAKTQSELLEIIAQEYEVGAVVRMSELWCEAAAFSVPCEITENSFPKLGRPLYQDADGLQNAPVPQAVNAVTEPLIEAAALAVPRMGKPLVVGVTGPYTLGAVLGGSQDFMMNCLMNPDAVHAFLERVTEFLIAYACAYKSAGAAAVIVAEPSACMISPQQMDEFSNRYISRIISAVQDARFSVIYHNCGAVNPHLNTIAGLGAHAFHFGSEVDIARAISCIGSDRFVMGNADPRLFVTGSEADIEKMARALMNRFAPFVNWRLSTGCDLPPNARHIDAFLQAAMG